MESLGIVSFSKVMVGCHIKGEVILHRENLQEGGILESVMELSGSRHSIILMAKVEKVAMFAFWSCRKIIVCLGIYSELKLAVLVMLMPCYHIFESLQ